MGFLFGGNKKIPTQTVQTVVPGATNVKEETTSTAREDANKQRRKRGFASTQLVESSTTGKTTLG